MSDIKLMSVESIAAECMSMDERKLATDEDLRAEASRLEARKREADAEYVAWRMTRSRWVDVTARIAFYRIGAEMELYRRALSQKNSSASP